jgi:signal transduction histidine kinase
MDEGFAVCEIVRDANGRAVDVRFLELNRALEAQTGLTQAGTVGRLMTEVFPGIDDSSLNLFAGVVDSGKSIRVEQRLGPLDRWYLVNAFPRGGDRYAVLYDDITERKRLGEALRRAHDELEERVRQRTLQLVETNRLLQIEVRERRAAEEQTKAVFRRLVTVQEEERRRIARDIHDQLGQSMTALRITLESLRSKAATQPALAEQSARAERLAEELDQNIDSLTWELRPASLDHFGLPAALARLVEGWSEKFRIPAEYATARMDGLRLDHEVETNLYHVAQEALHNIYKHADASHVAVMLEQRDGRVLLVIEDNGRGFNSAIVSGGSDPGLGLVSIRERALLVGGELEIESAPGQGTTVFIRVPIATASDDGFVRE